MILTLTNFRCWEQKTFTFPDTGICLVHGRSGRGKSTILNAIYFAISGKLKNVTSFGKKSTKVVLDIAPLVITRTRNPVSLTVVKSGEVTYTDAEAQAIIDAHFGQQFACCSYIDQDNTFSFAGMSPADKMEFLENAVMEEFKIDKMRDRIRDDISLTKIKHAECEGKIASLRSVLAGMKKANVPELTIDKNKVTLATHDKLTEKVANNLSVCERNVKVSLARIRRLEEQTEKAREWADFNQRKHTVAEKLAELNLEIETVHSYADVQKLSELEAKKDRFLRLQNAYKAREQLEELDHKIDQYQSDQDLSRATVKRELSAITPVSDEHIEILKNALTSIDTLSEWDSQLDGFDKDLERQWLDNEAITIKELRDLSMKMECPECNTPLQLVQGSLVKMNTVSKQGVHTDDLASRELAYRKRDKAFITRCDILERYHVLFEKVEKSLQPLGITEIDPDIINEQLQALNDRKMEINSLQTKLKQIDSDRTLLTYRRDREQLVNRTAILVNTEERQDDNLESIVAEMTAYREKHQQWKTLKNRHSEVSREHQHILQQCDQSVEPVDHDTLVAERDKYTENEEKVRKYRNYVDQLAEWKRLWDERERYEKVESDMADLADQRDEWADRMRGLVKLRDHVKVAEKQCMEEFIQSLNAHASSYIDHFFEDDDLHITLQTVQETKTGKEKIALNFDVIYRGLSTDLSCLSGGERDRVTLAYTLALSEMVHPTVLMLDECISSLDAETTSKVLDTLRESYKGKLVLLISHQANLGFFDSVLEI